MLWNLRAKLSLCLGLCVWAGLASWAAPDLTAEEKPGDQDQWIALFNGKDLTGWTPKIRGYKVGDNYNNTFRVENGVLKVSYDKYQKFGAKFGHLFYKTKYGHYRLRIEYRFVGEQAPGGAGWAIRNSGVMIHGESPETMDLDQQFPASIEVQFLGGNGTDPRSTANLCTPGTNVVFNNQLHTQHCTNSTAKTYHGDQWVTVELEVRGSREIKHIVEGQTVLTYQQPQLDKADEHSLKLFEKTGQLLLEEGTISLQSESHPVEFRKVELLPLAK